MTSMGAEIKNISIYYLKFTGKYDSTLSGKMFVTVGVQISENEWMTLFMVGYSYLLHALLLSYHYKIHTSLFTLFRRS